MSKKFALRTITLYLDLDDYGERIIGNFDNQGIKYTIITKIRNLILLGKEKNLKKTEFWHTEIF